MESCFIGLSWGNFYDRLPKFREISFADFQQRTWRGESGEQWSSAQGLESILISIQSLMSSNPYENEPGFENAKSERDQQNMAHYVAKVNKHRYVPVCFFFLAI